MAYFQIQDLSFTYPEKEKKTLSGVSFSLERGEFALLCGRSGSGKTTLLRQLKPVLAPCGDRTGEIYLDGIPLGELSPRDQAGKIGFVMQDPDAQIVTDKVWHELAFGLENLGCDEKTMALRVAEMASFFGIQGWFHREIGSLSGGQKQLLNLASVMAMQPEVLLLDEPTSQLDPISAGDFLNTLKKINRELGTTILITEHRTEDIFPAVDHVAVMEDGKLAYWGSPHQVGESLYREKNPFFSTLPAPARIFYQVQGLGACPMTVREGRHWLAESFPEAPRIPSLPEKEPEAGETALRVKDCWFRYTRDGQDILRDLNFQVPKGSLYAIVGGNGTGKSTALKAVCGICRPYRGRIEIFGKKQGDYRSGELFRSCLCMLPQDPGNLFVKDTVLEDLEEMGAERKAVTETAALCQVTELLSANPADLSGGEKQRAALAKVLLTKPKLLLLDEPTKGMDSIFKKQFASILQDLQRKGVTIIMVSHDVEFCASYADFVSMFFDGGILTTDTPTRFFGGSSFYTTAASRMSRGSFRNAVTAEQVAALYQRNREEGI